MREQYGDAVRRVSRPLMQAFNLTSDRTEQVVTRLIAPTTAALGLAIGLAAFAPEDDWIALAVSALLALFVAGGAIVAGKNRAVIWFAPLAAVAAHAFRLGLVPEDWTAAVLTPMALIGAAGAALYLFRRVTPLDALITLLGVVIPFVMIAGVYGFEGPKTYAGLLGVLLAGPYLFLFSRRDHVLGLAVAVGGYMAATQPMSAVSDWHYAGAGLVALGLFLAGRFMAMRSVRSETRRFIDGLYVAALSSIVFAPFWSEQTTLAVWLWAGLTSAVVALPMVSGPLRASAHSIMWAVLSAAVLTTALRELPESDIYTPLAYTVMTAVALGLAHGLFLLAQRLVLGGVRPFGQVFGALYLGAVLAGITAGVRYSGWTYTLLSDAYGEATIDPGWLAEAIRVYGGLVVASLGAYVIAARRRELDVIPVYRGLMSNRQAAFTRRVYRSIEETIPRIPLLNIFGALIAAGAEFLRHVRNNRGTPMVTELFVIGAAVAGYFLYSMQSYFGPPIPILPDGIWNEMVYLFEDEQTYSFVMSFGIVGYGVMLFLAGRLLRLRLLVYLALMAVLAPFLVQAFALFDYVTVDLFMAAAIVVAQGLLCCEIVRVLTIWNNEAPAQLKAGQKAPLFQRLGPVGMMIGLFAFWISFFGLGQLYSAPDAASTESLAPAEAPSEEAAVLDENEDVVRLKEDLQYWDYEFSSAAGDLLVSLAASGYGMAAIEQAAADGHARAMVILGIAHDLGMEGFRLDQSEAAAWYLQACELGEMRGCSNYGAKQFEGLGIPMQEAEAAASFFRACEAGVAIGCSNLASAYIEGRGVEQDVEEGRSLYVNACALGHKVACDLIEATPDGDAP